MTDDETLIFDYLATLEQAAQVLPADRRAELLEEIKAHIAEARAQSLAGPGGSGQAVRDVLARLGDPAEIVRVAGEASVPAFAGASGQPGSGGSGEVRGPGGTIRIEATQTTVHPGWPPAPGGAGPAGGPAYPGATSGARGQNQADPRSFRPGGLQVAAVSLAIGSGVLLPVLHGIAVIAWLVGVVLLWTSSRWRTGDKVLGTLVWPAGLTLAGILWLGSRGAAGGAAPYRLLVLADILATLAAAVVIAVRLLRRANQAAI